MMTTVQQLVTKLQSYPDNTVVTIRDVTEVEYFITAFDHGSNGLAIVINDEPEEDDPEQTEG